MPAEWKVVTAGEIRDAVGGELLAGEERATFTGLSTDSRAITRGQLFWSLQGEKFDGHDFIPSALARGASGIVTDRDYVTRVSLNSGTPVIVVKDTLRALGDLAGWWRSQYHLQVAAITGSTGKTTTKEMAAAILSLGESTLKNEGNFNNLVGLPLTLFNLNRRHRRAVLEMGMNRPGEIGRLTEIAAPDIGLITNIARAHLEGLKDINGVARAKAELIEKISSDKLVILNGDDALLLRTAAPFQKKIMTFGLGSKNDIQALEITNHKLEGLAFTLLYRGMKTNIQLRVPGLQNISNALAASAISLAMGVPVEQVEKGLGGYKGLKGRFIPVSLGAGVILIDDTYNANPSSLKAALRGVKALRRERGRTIVCLGQMAELGEETASAHREAGALIGNMDADYLLFMGENAAEVVAGARQAGLKSDQIKVVSTHQEMAQELEMIIQPDDLILLKGSRIMELEIVSRLLMEKLNPAR